MKVVARSSIRSINNVVVNGVSHDLGEVKIFSSQTDLADFIPTENHLAISWVHLKGDQILAAHRHPEPSLILVSEGQGLTLGDVEQSINAGDTVLVPSGSLHGFRGVGEGFWALSIQFNGKALYENSITPSVSFEATESAIDKLLNRNKQHLEAYSRSDLMQLLDSVAIHNTATQEVLLDCLQTWSDYFQRLLLLRAALSQHSEHQCVAADHLKDELGHNDNLRAQRGGKHGRIWDATMQSVMEWFKHRIMVVSDIEKTLLMHLIIEASGEVFHKKASAIFSDMLHFQEHGDDDGDHAAYGVALLKKASAAEVNDLLGPLDEGWQMMTLLCDRMAEMALAVYVPSTEY